MNSTSILTGLALLVSSAHADLSTNPTWLHPDTTSSKAYQSSRTSGWSMDRGRAVLSSTEPLTVWLDQPSRSVHVEIADRERDSLFQLRTWRGQWPQEDRILRFTDSDAASARIRSGIPFDRVTVTEIHDGHGRHPETIALMQIGGVAKGGLSTNAEATLCQAPLGLAYNLAFGAALVAVDPINAAIFNAATYTANMGLKFCKSVLEPPADLEFRVPAGSCTIGLQQERMVSQYENALGVPLGYDFNWGDLGTPFVYHHNTEVEILLSYGNRLAPRVGSLSLDDLFSEALSIDATDRIYAQCRDEGTVRFSSLPGDSTEYECPYVENRTLQFPVGNSQVLWRANAKMGILDLISPIIPGIPAAPKVPVYKTALLRIVRELGEIAGDAFLGGWRWNNVHDAFQTVTVFDEVAPTIVPDPADQPRITTSLVNGTIHVQIEADEPGGVSARNYQRLLQQMYQVSDACDRDTTFSADYPEPNLRVFWPVSTDTSDETFQITWTARDPGPNLDDERNETTTTMTVEVVDIRPPTIVPPPDIVEVGTGQVDELGQPLVFDFVDLDPAISNDANLPLTTGLHQITWTATDASGNSDSAVQIVNIKNSNADPMALAQTGADRQLAVSFEPQTIRLEGTDPDADPLTFYVEQHPQNGFFVAPLYPYFVEDYRLEQSVADAALTDQCANGPQGTSGRFDLEFPSEPSYITVTDEGDTFVVDNGSIQCSLLLADNFERQQRIARFNPDGSLHSSVHVDGFDFRDVIFDVANDVVVATSVNSAGDSFIRVYDTAFNPVQDYGLTNMDDTNGDCGNFGTSNFCAIERALSAVIDDLGLLYVMDETGRIYALDAERAPSDPVVFIDYLSDDVTGDAATHVPADSLAMDSEGFVYASRNNRIYKYEPARLNSEGQVVPGDPVGWMGRCDIDAAPGDAAVCDTHNRRSLGYSCTDATCLIDDAITQEEKDFCGFTFSNLGHFGCRPGQFRSPRGIDIDPRDNLYVADSANERIQRFTVDGFFAGEAESSCDGSCFVLGDFGKPQDVSVNSDHFYILDPSTNLVHVSLLTPFTEIGPDFAELVYQSNNDFACTLSADCVDAFAFSVSDGVRHPDTGLPIRSAPATVEVEVMRNFRPPVATPGIAWTVMEEVATPIILDGAEIDPLDTLTFAIDADPENGSVFISGNEAIYQSAVDFVGSDSFSFTVSDGMDVSAAEAVLVTVLNVNDAPRVDPLDDATVAMGYAFDLRHSFIDPDPGDTQMVTVDWGDGTIEDEGTRDAMGNASGPILDAAGTGPGRITADHIYTAAGAQTLQICVTDNVDIATNGDKTPTGDSETGCAEATLMVIDGVDVDVTAQSSQSTLVPGQIVTQTFRALNTPPAAGPPQTVTGLTLTVELPRELDASSLSVSPATCQVVSQRIVCDPVTLNPGFSFQASFTATVPVTTPIGSILQSRATATLDQEDQTPANEAVLNVPVLPPADFTVAGVADSLVDAPDGNPGDGQCQSADGVCTLRAAIQEANAMAGQQVIALGNGVYQNTEAHGNLPLISGDLIILGSGADQTIIDAAGQGRGLAVGSGVSLRVEDVTITGASGQGVLVSVDGDLTMRRSRLTGNHDASSFGGGIQASGNLDLRDVTLDGNSSVNDGGGIFAFNDANTTLVNVTVVGNRGGGVTLTGGSHSMTNVTITGNDGGAGWVAAGGALNVFGGAQLSLVNTVVADNRLGPRGATPNCLLSGGGQVQSLGNNAFGDLSGCAISPLPSDLAVADARLRSADVVRSTLPVVRPFADSALVDAGSTADCPEADTRSVARPQDGNQDGVTGCDIGAAELLPEVLFASGFE